MPADAIDFIEQKFHHTLVIGLLDVVADGNMSADRCDAHQGRIALLVTDFGVRSPAQ